MHLETFIVPLDIPAEKAAARDWLATQMEGAPITKIPTRPESKPRPWKPKPKPQAANDNQESIPICEALVRDKRHDDADMIRRYRLLVDVAGLPEEEIKTEVGNQGIDVARRTDFAENGVMRDHGVRVSAKVAISRGVRNTITADDIPRPASVPARPTIGEDNIIAHIDTKAILGPLRAALGPLLDVFELAALSDLTMTAIGELRGFKGKQASAAGKMAVYMAVDTLREAWNREKRVAGVKARQADETVNKASNKREAANILFFGRDIKERPGTIYGRAKAA